jgi:hypothetical protein
MPPKQETPDLIFVSESRTGAMTHHTKLDDIVGLIFDHLKGSVLTRGPEDPFFYFALFVIDCTPNLHFTKKFMIFSHDEIKGVFDEIDFDRLDLDECGVTDLEDELNKKFVDLKREILPKIKDLVSDYISNAFNFK